jgi:hypothetical protein
MILLNDRWRVIESDDRLPYCQWLLQRLDGKTWHSRSFCQTRKALLVAINEKIVRADRFYQGGHAMEVDQQALDAIRNLPERCPQRDQPSGTINPPSDS